MPKGFGIVGLDRRGRGPYEKPAPGAVIDPQHPLAQGLAGSWLFNEFGGLRVKDYCGNRHGTLIGTFQWTADGLYTGTAGSRVAFDSALAFASDDAWTIVFRVRPDSYSAVTGMLLGRYNTSSDFIWFYNNNVTLRNSVPNDKNWAISSPNTSFALRHDGINARLYQGGVAVGTDGAISPQFYIDNIGSAYNNASYSFLGSIYSLGIYLRALNPTEIAQLHASPYQMFWEPGRRAIFVPMEAGGATYERSLSDGISLGDSVGRAVTWARELTDGMELGDGLSRTVACNRSLADGLALGDSAGRTAAYVRALAEPMTLGEDLLRALSYVRVLAEPMTLGDDVTSITVFVRALADAIALGDSSTVTAAFVRALADAIALGDSASSVPVLFHALSDAIVMTDAVVTASAFVRALTDAVSLADSISRTVTFFRLLSDTLELSDVRTVTLGDRRQQFSATFSAGGPATSSFSAGGPATSSFSVGGPAGA